MIERLDTRAIERVSGPSWEALRQSFFEVSRILLAVSADATSELTTIYVKYCTSSVGTQVYAVVWLRTSKEIVIGLSLPGTTESCPLGAPPQGTKYKGLTKYLTVRAGDVIPEQFPDWARLAFLTAKASETCGLQP
jgi:hypothetical protein